MTKAKIIFIGPRLKIINFFLKYLGYENISKEYAPRSIVSTANHEYKIEDYNITTECIFNLMESLEKDTIFQKIPYSFLNQYEDNEVKALVLRKIFELYNEDIYYSKIILKLQQKEFFNLRVFAIAPKVVALKFINFGIPVEPVFSNFLWSIYRISVLNRFIIKNLTAFILLFLELLKSLSKAVIFKNRVNKKSYIFWNEIPPGIPIDSRTSDETKLNFFHFINEKRISITEFSHHFIQSNRSSEIQTEKKYFNLGKNPFKPKLRGFSSIIEIVKDGFYFQFIILFESLLNFLNSNWSGYFICIDACELPKALLWFNREKPNAVCLTFSTSFPFWVILRNITQTPLYVFFMSTNSTPLERNGRVIGSQNYIFKNIPGEKYVVWDKNQANWLCSLNNEFQKSMVIGPVIYGKLHFSEKIKKTDNMIYIGVFDVIPYKADYLIQIGYGEIYYNLENTKKFLSDIIDSCRNSFGENGFKILYKPKRNNNPYYDQDYWNFIQNMVGQSYFILEEPEINPIYICYISDFVISMPFSSPSVIGSFLKRKSCFYDPTATIHEPSFKEPRPPLVRGVQELTQFLKSKE